MPCSKKRAGMGSWGEQAAPHGGAQGIGEGLEHEATVLGHVFEAEVHAGTGARGVLREGGEVLAVLTVGT